MRKLAIALLFGLVVSMFAMAYADETQHEIASSVVRLHIVANSDSDGDQAVKLKVRDAIIEEFSDCLQAAQSPAQAEQIMQDNLGRAVETANRVLKENGFSYQAQASIGEAHFPVKHYENITLPPGNYRALRIVLGSGSGQNWWCVMYPPLCFTGSVEGSAPQESQDTLKSSLGEENYALITDGADEDGDLPVQFKFKILEIFDSLFAGE